MPLAQHLADAMAAENVEVIGYHGLGTRMDTGHFHKSRALPSMYNSGNREYIEARKLRTKFTANNPPERLPGKEPFSSNR